MFQRDAKWEEILTERILLMWTFEKVLKDNMWEEAEEEEKTWNVPQFRKKTPKKSGVNENVESQSQRMLTG